MIIDQNGLVASRDWAGNIDRGDTLAETGRIYFLKKLCGIEDSLMPFENTLAYLQDENGKWRRAPQQWTDPNDVSRDQLDPMIMALVFYKEFHLLALTNMQLVHNFLRYPNGDLASPEHLSHFTRHNRGSKVLWFPDLFMLLNTLIICFLRPKRVENDLNHIISLCHAEYFGGTFISRFAARVYLKRRDYVKALLTYYKPETGNGDLVKYYLMGLTWLKTRL